MDRPETLWGSCNTEFGFSLIVFGFGAIPVGLMAGRRGTKVNYKLIEKNKRRKEKKNILIEE